MCASSNGAMAPTEILHFNSWMGGLESVRWSHFIWSLSWSELCALLFTIRWHQSSPTHSLILEKLFDTFCSIAVLTYDSKFFNMSIHCLTGLGLRLWMPSWGKVSCLTLVYSYILTVGINWFCSKLKAGFMFLTRALARWTMPSAVIWLFLRSKTFRPAVCCLRPPHSSSKPG